MVGVGCSALQQRVSPHADLPNPNTMIAEFQGSEEPKVRIWLEKLERSLNVWTLHHLWGFGGQMELT